ncbi:hypothetical protein LXA43DRAFT_885165 [Ganoderma leucocontextum]|nr:hypothetical protein LXA43DRAFT_885165 [Ganoderma leucocontextum]
MRAAGSTVATCRPYLRLGFRTLLCLAIVLAGHVYSHPTGQIFAAGSSLRSLSRRQNTPSLSSSFNWWPYPSWGLSTTASATASTSQPSPTSSVTAVNAAAVSGTATTVTGLASSTTTPSSSSVSLVLITALPPASRESSITLSRAHAARSKPAGNGFTIAYLAPLFAVLGAIVGGVLTWLIYRYLGLPARRGPGSGARESALLPGPAYAPPSRFKQGASTAMAPLSDGEAGREQRADTSPRPAGNYSGGPDRTRTWLSRTMLRRNKPLPNPSEPSAQDRSEVDLTEDDPFLGDMGSSAADAPPESPPPGRRPVGGSVNTPRRVTSPDPYSALSDTEDAVPYETIRHKSIKRAILERIRFGTMREPNYERGKTTEDDAETPLRTDSATPRRGSQHRKGQRRTGTDGQITPPTDGVTSSRHPTLARTRSQEVISPPGFRILVEDPTSGALMDEDVDFTPASSSSSRRHRRTPDKFTRIPDRRNPEEKRGTPRSLRMSAPKRAATGASASASEYSSPTPSSKPRPVRPAMNRYESSILLSSPPLVTSPALESQLFFGSIVSPHPPRLPEISALKVSKQRTGTADSSALTASPPAKQGHLQPKKLRTQRSPPLLPFPTMAESSPFRNRLKKPPHGPPHAYIPLASHATRADSTDSMDAASESFATAPTGSPEKATAVKKLGRTTPAERYHARHTALERVDAILSRSWSERQDNGVESPNNFGGFLGPILGADFDREMGKKDGDGPDGKAAIASPEEFVLSGAGLEQRLQGSVH